MFNLQERTGRGLAVGVAFTLIMSAIIMIFSTDPPVEQSADQPGQTVFKTREKANSAKRDRQATAASAPAAPVKPIIAPALANPDTPLTEYTPVGTEGEFAALYFALTDEPIDYGSLASRDSYPYRAEANAYKKQELLDKMTAGYKSKMQAFKSRYFSVDADNVRLGHYDLASGNFPLEEGGISNSFPRGTALMMASYSPTILLHLKYQNPEKFRFYRVDDQAKAKALEELPYVQRGKKAKLYLFAHSVNPDTHTINAEIVRVQILGHEDQVVADLKGT